MGEHKSLIQFFSNRTYLCFVLVPHYNLRYRQIFVIFFHSISSTVPIDPPENITITSPDATTLRIEWHPPFTTISTPYSITGYILFYRNIRETSSLDYSKYATNDTTTTADLTGLAAGTTYIVRILSYTKDGNGVASRGIEFTTQQLCKFKTLCIDLFSLTPPPPLFFSIITFNIIGKFS